MQQMTEGETDHTIHSADVRWIVKLGSEIQDHGSQLGFFKALLFLNFLRR